jgi:hypothetical protein
VWMGATRIGGNEGPGVTWAGPGLGGRPGETPSEGALAGVSALARVSALAGVSARAGVSPEGGREPVCDAADVGPAAGAEGTGGSDVPGASGGCCGAGASSPRRRTARPQNGQDGDCAGRRPPQLVQKLVMQAPPGPVGVRG